MAPKYAWRQCERNPSTYGGVSRKLWLHGDVFQLVRKGTLLDTPLDCYASHARSRHSVLLQFGNNTVICNADDAKAQRETNAKEVLPHFARHQITRDTLADAFVEGDVPLAHKGALLRGLKRFVGFYFRA